MVLHGSYCVVIHTLSLAPFSLSLSVHCNLCVYIIILIVVFTRIVAMATINFALSSVRLLIEGG